MNDKREFVYDVFVSYSHRDKVWVTQIPVPWLESAGLRVCIDDRDFMPGRPALMNMQNAVKSSRHTLLVMSQAWVESEWTRYESILIRTSDPDGSERRTIPLRLEPCDVPDFISMLTWIDFTQPNQLKSVQRQLLIALGVSEQQAERAPTLQVTKPDTQIAEKVNAQGARNSPLNWTIPMPQMKRVFSQREQDLYLEQSFRMTRAYFEQALQKLEATFPEVETSLMDVNALKFICRLYKNGEEINQCKIWIGGLSKPDCICYSEGRFNMDTDSSMNDWLSVTVLDSGLFLQPSGMKLGYQPTSRHEALTQEEAAEYLWTRLTERLNY